MATSFALLSNHMLRKRMLVMSMAIKHKSMALSHWALSIAHNNHAIEITFTALSKTCFMRKGERFYPII